jgi:hypothetical protein
VIQTLAARVTAPVAAGLALLAFVALLPARCTEAYADAIDGAWDLTDPFLSED